MGGGGVRSGGASGLRVRVDVNGERRSKVFEKKLRGIGRGRGWGSDQGLGGGGGGSKVFGRWVMWGMEDVNQE